MASLPACLLLSTALAAVAAIEIWPPFLPAKTRIHNGTLAQLTQFPYMADIRAEGAGGSAPCSGSLITRWAVLTAAGCVHGYNTYSITLGSVNRSADGPYAWSVVSRWALVHPDYDMHGYADLAIIYLPEQAPVNEYILMVDLPDSPFAGSFLGHRAILSGWGFSHSFPDPVTSKVLLWAPVVVIPEEACKQHDPNITVTDRSLCTGSTTPVVYTGSYGAALVVKNGGRSMQIGVLSRSKSDSYNSTFPQHHARLSSFIDWIKLKTVPY